LFWVCRLRERESSSRVQLACAVFPPRKLAHELLVAFSQQKTLLLSGASSSCSIRLEGENCISLPSRKRTFSALLIARNSAHVSDLRRRFSPLLELKEVEASALQSLLLSQDKSSGSKETLSE
jgi:hypothetical protein